MPIAFIGMGSNIKPRYNLRRALSLLESSLRIVDISNFYQTRPVGNVEQPEFINGVIRVETTAEPVELKTRILAKVELRLGRTRNAGKNSPRTIDLDLLLYGNRTLHQKGVCIPAPDIRNRWFVGIPLHQLDPNLILPDTGEPIARVVTGFGEVLPKPLTRFSNLLRREHMAPRVPVLRPHPNWENPFLEA